MCVVFTPMALSFQVTATAGRPYNAHIGQKDWKRSNICWTTEAEYKAAQTKWMAATLQEYSKLRPNARSAQRVLFRPRKSFGRASVGPQSWVLGDAGPRQARDGKLGRLCRLDCSLPLLLLWLAL